MTAFAVSSAGICQKEGNRLDGAPRKAFLRAYRLTKTDEYSSVFGFRRALRGRFFLLHYGALHPATGSRLGLVIGKKFLKRAVGRNLVKRILREQFRLLRASLPERDFVFRLTVKLSGVDRRLRREIAEEARQLLGKARAGKGCA
ncbi:MAG: ribonuclease P protein component [Zoogloeaceae bacterium]|jgi:ribonuclease P protein component|nr:ribonuclease P protein component [Zoogloeaceae bacterium]